METNIVNVLLSTLPGLNLPRTLCLPVPAQLTTRDLLWLIDSLIPSHIAQHLRLTTNTNRLVFASQETTVINLVTAKSSTCLVSDFLPLRMSAVLVGGKGGFGSQLRAAGGRMSSRKRKQNAELATGSARNLDGRRLRTITEAKNLATYLATKPEMDRRQKEERRKRWEQVIDLAEQREADMRAGKGADGRRKGLSEEWIEEKEEVGENVKNAVNLAMSSKAQVGEDKENDSDRSAPDSADEVSDDEDPMELDQQDMARLTREAESGDPDALWVLKNKLRIPASLLPKQKPQRRFAGFDEDEDEDENDEDDGSEDAEDVLYDADADNQEISVTADTADVHSKGKASVHEKSSRNP